MTSQTHLRRQGGDTGSWRCHAFTLIELLTVMAIIVVLAGLVLGTVGLANSKAARARTQAEIKELETALTAYQGDMGGFPRNAASDGTTTSGVYPKNAAHAGDPASYYSSASILLYQALSGNYYLESDNTIYGTYKVWSATAGGSAPAEAPKIYKNFPIGQLQLIDTTKVTNGTTTPDNVKSVIDAFGFSYGYSTAYAAMVEANKDGATKGYNPTFDLWSTAGYGTGGKSYPSDLSTPEQKSTVWITNWSQ
jgi:prepilin-type N-terminal cleavage/methylation domain-containing protein